MKKGLTGTDVKQWQTFLKTRGFDLPANGKFGPETHRATMIFQKKWKLYVDGVVGPQTLRKARQLGFGASPVSNRSNKSNNGTSQTRIEVPAGYRLIEYSVQGYGTYDVTYTNDQGGVEQVNETYGNWRKKFLIPIGTSITIDAMNDDIHTDIVVDIYVSGRKVRSSTGSGPNSTASCNYTVQ